MSVPDPAPDELARLDRAPDFFVVGAAKSGTTSLHHYLSGHPDVFLPDRQEPGFFAFAGEPPRHTDPNGGLASVASTAVHDADTYGALYAPAGERLRGDVSPVYLYLPDVAARLRHAAPAARIVVVLRQPADRAFSAYMHARREGKEPLSFEDALAAEPERIAADCGFLWRYADLGRYAAQVRRYLDAFPREQLFFGRFDDLAASPDDFLARLLAFLDVDASAELDTGTRHNPSGEPRSRAQFRLLRRTGPLRPLGKALEPVVGRERLQRWQSRVQGSVLQSRSLDPLVRRRVTDGFAEDIMVTASLTGLDLDAWLARPGGSVSG